MSKKRLIQASFDKTMWSPLRIKYDFTYFFKDDYSCKSVGQSVNWAMRATCQAGDLENAEKTQKIQKTFSNLQNYLKKLLKVHPTLPFIPDRYSQSIYPVSSNKVSDADMVIFVYARPFPQNSGTLANAGSLQWSNGDRPTTGIMNINYLKFGNEESKVSDALRDIFETLFHETCHALGISGSGFSNWVREDGTTYGNSQISPTHSCTKKGKTFTFLSTPKVVEKVKERFGLTGRTTFDDSDFSPPCKIGLELEDAGGSGTAGSHWDIRAYYSELMTGVTPGFGYISDLTLAALQDTGWFQVDFSYSEPFFYGDYRGVIGESPWTHFPTGEPQKYFPKKNYIAIFSNSEKTQYGPNFDYRGFGQASYSDTMSSKCLKYPSFADPEKSSRSGNGFWGDYTDCQDIISFWRTCKANTEELVAISFSSGTIGPNSYVLPGIDGPSSTCARMTCDANNNLAVFDPAGPEKGSVACAKEGDIVFTSFKCPDPKIICGMINYKLNNRGVIPSEGGGGNTDNVVGISEKSDETTTEPNKGNKTTIIAVSAVVAVLVIGAIIAVTVVVLIRRKRISNENDVGDIRA